MAGTSPKHAITFKQAIYSLSDGACREWEVRSLGLVRAQRAWKGNMGLAPS